MGNGKFLDTFQKSQGQGSDLSRVLPAVSFGQSGCHHVGVPNGLHLIDVVHVDLLVKESVHGVEEVDDLQWSADRGELREAHDVAEVYGDVVEVLGIHSYVGDEGVRDFFRKHCMEELVGSLLFDVECHGLLLKR